jgi:hypothetical protein
VSDYGSAGMLAWLVDEQGIEPHVPVFDKSGCKDGTFSRTDFNYDQDGDVYVCPAEKQLRKRHCHINAFYCAILARRRES